MSRACSCCIASEHTTQSPPQELDSTQTVVEHAYACDVHVHSVVHTLPPSLVGFGPPGSARGLFFTVITTPTSSEPVPTYVNPRFASCCYVWKIGEVPHCLLLFCQEVREAPASQEPALPSSSECAKLQQQSALLAYYLRQALDACWGWGDLDNEPPMVRSLSVLSFCSFDICHARCLVYLHSI